MDNVNALNGLGWVASDAVAGPEDVSLRHPAQAGIQTTLPPAIPAKPARPDSRLRGDDDWVRGGEYAALCISPRVEPGVTGMVGAPYGRRRRV